MEFTLTSNDGIAPKVYRATLEGDTSAITAPGQFVQVSVPGFFLRRPISVCDWEDGRLTLIYKIAGQGTERMALLRPGETLDVLTGLGNGYDLTPPMKAPLLAGGGAGVPPLYGLCKRLLTGGLTPHVILGFNEKKEIFLEREFKALGVPVTVATVDGSAGVKGFAAAAMQGVPHDYFFACGPEAMLKSVSQATAAPGQMSFEERMACGFGACMGCSRKTKNGYKRICKDGPVLQKEEVLW